MTVIDRVRDQAEAEWLAYARDAVRDGDADLAAERTTDMNAAAFSTRPRALPPKPQAHHRQVLLRQVTQGEVVRADGSRHGAHDRALQP